MQGITDKIVSHSRASAEHWLLKRELHKLIGVFRKCRLSAVCFAIGMMAASPTIAGGIYVSKGDLYWSGKKACVEWGYSGGSGVNRCNATKDKQAYPCRGIFKRNERMDVRQNIPRGTTVQIRVCI